MNEQQEVVYEMRTLVICVILMLALTVSAFAQAELKSEISFSAGWTSIGVAGESVKITDLIGEYGKFIQPNVALQVALAYVNIDVVGESASAWLIAPQVAYYFNQDPAASWVPYVGAGFYYASGKSGSWSDSNTNFTWKVGVKNFLGKTMDEADRALFIEYRSFSKVLKEANVSTIMVGITNYF